MEAIESPGHLALKLRKGTRNSEASGYVVDAEIHSIKMKCCDQVLILRSGDPMHSLIRRNYR